MELIGEGLIKSYKDKKAVNSVNIKVNSGEIVGLLGPNGAGKSTTFSMLVGFLTPDYGKVFIDSKDVSDLPLHKRALMGLGYLAQEPTVFRNLTVYDNLKAVIERTSLSKADADKKINSLLEEFAISHLKNQKAHTLSGGEKRRLEAARVMINSPKIILLDEPFAGVDPITVGELKKIIIKLKEKNIGILISDHNVRDTLSVTDRAYLIYKGEVLTEGSSDTLIKDEKARELYLGSDFKM
ncbi:MAG: LPS export ABC transporter ATP-binding protein [Elusimicrobia bacterium]|nr:LPS export ABC transporter ATP-binding protein [Elusimicrobiota bacterium]